MLIPCVSCGSREYTEESPLWFHCDSCLKQHRKMLERKHKEEYKAFRKYHDMGICDGCGIEKRIIDLEYIEMYEGYFCIICSETEVG